MMTDQEVKEAILRLVTRGATPEQIAGATFEVVRDALKCTHPHGPRA